MKKLIKMLLAMILLLSMISPVAAETETTEEPVHNDVCQHSSWHWETIKEATCLDIGVRNKVCDLCGIAFEREMTARADHKYGDWTVTRQATCAEAGSQVRYCIWCGVSQTEGIPKLTEHQYGDWIIIREANCKDSGEKERICSVCGDTQTETIPETDEHQYADWVIVTEASCTKDGKKTATCSICGATKKETIPMTGHDYSDWEITSEASCKGAGSRSRICSRCGDVQTETIPKMEHQYSDWVITKEPTCVSNGQKSRTCSMCGDTQYLQLKKVDHIPGEWTVTKEPDCNHPGTRTARCTVCGKRLKETLPKTEHEFGEWEIVVPETDHSKGKKVAVCALCKKKITEEFFPEGTLYKGGDNPADEVTELQQALSALGFYSGEISGDFDNTTADAVRKFQKKIDLPTKDGIAWPQTKKLLGLGVEPGVPVIPEDMDSYMLQLSVVQTSPVMDSYSEGDQIVYQWTLTNASAKTDALSVCVYLYKGSKSSRKTDTEIGQPETLVPDEIVTGEYIYTVTRDDVAAGRFKVGFISRCKFNKKDSASNDVYFFSYASGGEGADSSDS